MAQKVLHEFRDGSVYALANRAASPSATTPGWVNYNMAAAASVPIFLDDCALLSNASALHTGISDPVGGGSTLIFVFKPTLDTPGIIWGMGAGQGVFRHTIASGRANLQYGGNSGPTTGSGSWVPGPLFGPTMNNQTTVVAIRRTGGDTAVINTSSHIGLDSGADTVAGLRPSSGSNVIVGGGYGWSPPAAVPEKWYGFEYWDNVVSDSDLRLIFNRWHSNVASRPLARNATHLITPTTLNLDGSLQGIDGARTVFDIPGELNPREVFLVPNNGTIWTRVTGYTISTHPTWGTKRITLPVAPTATQLVQIIF